MINKIEKFKLDSNLKYNNYYEYSKVVYNSQLETITIVCPNHGDFLTTAYKHLYTKNSGICQICLQEEKNNDFISKAKITHGTKYDYSKVFFTKEISNVIIICKEHGEFSQSARDHYKRGSGCPKCSLIKNGIQRRISEEEFIKRCNLIHSNKYDYTDLNYEKITQKIPLKIKCPEHGVFEQLASVHLYSKSGCSKCYGNYQYNTEEFIEIAKKSDKKTDSEFKIKFNEELKSNNTKSNSINSRRKKLKDDSST